jgi:excisionase family DNA binding protein
MPNPDHTLEAPTDVERLNRVAVARAKETAARIVLAEARAELAVLHEPPAGDGAEDGERLLDAREAAKLAGVHPNTVYGAATRGDLEFVPIGRLRRFRRADVMAWGRS